MTPKYLTSFTKGTDVPRRESLLSRFSCEHDGLSFDGTEFYSY